MSASQVARLVRLERLAPPACAVCASWPQLVCVARPGDAEVVADRGGPRGVCPGCGTHRPVVVGVDCDAI